MHCYCVTKVFLSEAQCNTEIVTTIQVSLCSDTHDKYSTQSHNTQYELNIENNENLTFNFQLYLSRI